MLLSMYFMYTKRNNEKFLYTLEIMDYILKQYLFKTCQCNFFYIIIYVCTDIVIILIH